MKNVKLSIIIITYNRSMEVIRAIKSLLINNVLDSEIIIWDNHSADGHSRSVREYCEELTGKLKYYYAEQNLGVGGGRNAAWQQSCGEYVFFMDDDAVIYSEDYLHRLVKYMDDHPIVGAASTVIYEPSTNQYYDCRYQAGTTEGTMKTLSFVGGAHIVRRKAIARGILYPRNGHFGSEELYASFSIWNSGYEVHKLEELVVYHLPTATNRYLGKERDKLVIVTTYLMKKLMFPIILQPVVFILFQLHLWKNGFYYDQICHEIITKSFYAEDIHRISFRCINKLVQLFGLRALL